MNDPIELLFEDATCLVVNKPSGLLTTRTGSLPCLESVLASWLSQRSSSTETPFLRMPHRLDRAVSGAVLVARTPAAAKIFGAQFESGKVEKRYLALVHGIVEPISGEWIDSIRKCPDRAAAEIVDSSVSGARRAVLRYCRTAVFEASSVLEIELQTGRMHQIRLQASHRGHPIIGDSLYGSPIRFGTQDEGVGLPDGGASSPADARFEEPIALHASRIGFRHPKTAVPIGVDAPLPGYWPDV